jgi:hypothetical protein
MAKSRADKTAAKTAQAAATPVTHDIVPGKFTDHDWIFMLERDDADDFIAELLTSFMTVLTVSFMLITYSRSWYHIPYLKLKMQFFRLSSGSFLLEMRVTLFLTVRVAVIL